MLTQTLYTTGGGSSSAPTGPGGGGGDLQEGVVNGGWGLGGRLS